MTGFIEGLVSLARLLLGLVAVQAVGCGLAAWLAPAWTRLERQAAGFGLGALVITLWMLGLSALGIPFRLPLIVGPPVGLVAGLWIGRRVRAGAGQEQPLAASRDAGVRFQGWDWVFLGLLAAVLVFAALRAALFPMWSWDALATWGFKAKVFYLRGGVDFQGFEAHNYYPNLVPLLLAFLYQCLGQVNDSLVKLVFPCFGAALLLMLFCMLRRQGLSLRQALGVTAFFALNGVTFVYHLYIAYADLALTYYTLGAAGWVHLWLRDAAPRRSLALAALFCAAIPWCKFEGAPLAGTVLLAAGLTLLWLRPRGIWRRLASLAVPLAGLVLGSLPWRWFAAARGIETGSDHILGFYPQQFLGALLPFLWTLVNPWVFGLLWPAALLALACSGKQLFTTPRLYLVLFLGGNFLAIVLAYAVAPTSHSEFPLYIRATLDRLLLHIAPVAALAVGEGLSEAGVGAR